MSTPERYVFDFERPETEVSGTETAIERQTESKLLILLMVARGGIEPPTRGFSVPVSNLAKSLIKGHFLATQCEIFRRLTDT